MGCRFRSQPSARCGTSYRQGQRQLAPAGTDRSDDRGEYRVFGLEPGDYYVSATVPRRFPASVVRASPDTRGSGRRDRRDRLTDPFEPPRLDDDRELGCAQTYYPGVTGLGQAAPVAVGLSAEMTGVDFGVLLVPTARVSGTVLSTDGSLMGGAQVLLLPEDGVLFRGAMNGALAQSGGRFEIRDVPPGRYTVRAMTRGARGRGGQGGRAPNPRCSPVRPSQSTGTTSVA